MIRDEACNAKQRHPARAVLNPGLFVLCNEFYFNQQAARRSTRLFPPGILQSQLQSAAFTAHYMNMKGNCNIALQISQ